jgi:large subunit ribosomal protein L7/L12
MAVDLKKVAEQLVGLTVLEVNELGKILKDEYGIEPAAAVAVAAAAPAEGGEAAGAGEKAEYDVILKDAGAQKVAVIKAVKEKVAKADAETIKKALEAAGATVELV